MAWVRRVTWVAVFDIFIVSHLVGDFLFQTDWQATHKAFGLGTDPECRRALFSHLTTYILTFVPAAIWIGLELSWWRGAAALVVIYVPHLIQDDRRLLDAYMRRVKGPGSVASGGLMVACDQSFHLVALFATALLVVS